MRNWTVRQWIALAGFLSLLGTSQALLVATFKGLPHDHEISLLLQVICGLAGFAGTALLGVVYNLTGQKAELASVNDMPGVERMVVNAKANKTLAEAALDDKFGKIVPAPGAEAALRATANGT